jgi:hypothetical protein
MFRKELALIAILCTFFAGNLQAEQIHSTWVGGASGIWEDASNWNPPIVPDNGYAVMISDAEVDLQENHIIDQLDCYGNVVFGTGHTKQGWWVGLDLEDANGLRNHGYLSTESLVMLHIHGNLDNPEGCTIDTAVNGGIDVDGNVENAGLIISCPPAGLLCGPVHNVGQIIIFGGVCGSNVLDNDSTGIIKGFGTVGGMSPFINKGKIYATGGGLTVATDDLLLFNSGTMGNAALASVNVMHPGVVMNIGVPTDTNNFGTIEVNAGGGVAFDCNLVNEPNGVIKLLGGTLAATSITQSADANFAGFGGINGDVVIEPNGLIKLTGPTNVVGDVEIKNDATLQISDGLTLITGQTTCNGTIHIKGGYVIPQGGLSGNCNVIWEPGLYTNVADFNLDGKVNLEDFAYFADTWLWQTAWR